MEEKIRVDEQIRDDRFFGVTSLLILIVSLLGGWAVAGFAKDEAGVGLAITGIVLALVTGFLGRRHKTGKTSLWLIVALAVGVVVVTPIGYYQSKQAHKKWKAEAEELEREAHRKHAEMQAEAEKRERDARAKHEENLAVRRKAEAAERVERERERALCRSFGPMHSPQGRKVLTVRAGDDARQPAAIIYEIVPSPNSIAKGQPGRARTVSVKPERWAFEWDDSGNLWFFDGLGKATCFSGFAQDAQGWLTYEVADTVATPDLAEKIPPNLKWWMGLAP